MKSLRVSPITLRKIRSLYATQWGAPPDIEPQYLAELWLEARKATQARGRRGRHVHLETWQFCLDLIKEALP